MKYIFPNQDKELKARAVMTFFSCHLFPETRTSFLLSKCFFEGETPKIALRKWQLMFIALKVSFEQIYYAVAEKPDKLL